MTIHSTHPFVDPEPDDVRRLRGRLGGAVSLWTAGVADERAGLTVTSLMLAHGEQARVLALLDPDSDLLAALETSRTSVVQLLSWPDRGLAEMFAGTAPAPGGLFRQAEFVTTDWGPRLAGATTWAGVRLESGTDVGWSRLVTCAVEHVEVGEETDPLGHRRGRFVRL
ncbi:flavin reductase [Nocardioides sp.]|uniref:flavin reductase family protein n=1 Tax=Nocardioides sp. TaxID=35761 RepID=UPI001A2F7DC4|nr:flavin reductase [Nocardioides sp.]MBJ7356226.1 flavin reductase [Nocardioides sp.]